ncbi:Uncharacterized protein BM_BM10401 [Brugia malayi]|uniref:Bm10401 n=1 Tax=Brugia malayi TaxID=6279 RepID=A0A5K1UXC4_BRUMA|nr:Uncharacterized protein BM_BM10401 [Brugia malayi]VIO93777.1 Uncharacterized protein BM_BM10401 [Brugia malayi]
MSFYNLSGYCFKNVEKPSSSGRHVFDTTKSSHRTANIPEIGSTIYNTIQTGGETLVDGSSESKESETGSRPMSETSLRMDHSKSFKVFKSESHTKLSRDKIRSDSISNNKVERRTRKRNKGVIVREYENDVEDKNSPYNDLITRYSYNHGPGGYCEDVSGSARNHRMRKNKSRLRLLSRRRLGVSLYDGTDSVRDYSSRSSRNREVYEETEATSGTGISLLSIPDKKKTRMRQNAILITDIAAMRSDKTPQCLLQLPISVITEQRIRVTTTVRQLWLHSTIYVYSASELGHCNIEELEKMLVSAPIMNREVSETKWDKRPLNLKEDIFVKNNIIKIRRSTLFCDLQDGKQVIASDRRTYDNLCPAEVTNIAQREVYGNVALRPQSMLNITLICGERRSINGNIRLIEKLIITLSSSKEPEASHRLQRQIEERVIKPENYHLPIQYTEEVLIGQRRIDITREAEINPPKGLSEFLTAGEPQIFEFGEIRKYGDFAESSSQSFGHIPSSYPIQRSLPSFSTVGQMRQVKETKPEQFSSSYVSRYRSQSSEADEHLKEQIPIQKFHPETQIETQGVNATGIPIINSTAESQVSTKQKQLIDSAKREKIDLRSKKAHSLRRGLRRSSRWSRFALSRSQSHPNSTESIRTVPATFSPLETSTPIKKTPTTAKDLIDRNKFPMKECVKTSKSQSSGTGTHIRSTLDCDITLSTTKEVNVTEIPIEIKGELNGLPWCTTIRLRVKHDANEKPTFIPNRLSLNHNVLWQNENLQKEQSKDATTAVKK